MCGICGFVPNNDNDIDILRFKSLLLQNESRGKLSTGIHNIEGLSKTTENAFDFAENKNWHDLTKSSVFLGHTRQPTLGYPVTIKGAQPMVYSNIALIHNGSIYNSAELANKYNVKVEEDDTDSAIMAKILEGKHFDVLEYYNGAAALIWTYLDDPDTLYYYKGVSKVSSFSATESNERPLFKIITKEGVYFSSLENSLINVSLSPDEIESIVEVADNVILSINRKDIHSSTIVKRIDRKSHQTKIVKSTIKRKVTKRLTNGYGGNTYHGHANTYGRNYNLYDDYEDIYDEEGYPTTELTGNDEIAMASLIKEGNHTLNTLFNSNNVDLGDEEINPKYIESYMVYFNKGRYWVNGVPIEGMVRLLDTGEISLKGNYYTFVNGIILKNSSVNAYKAINTTLKYNNYKFGSLGFSELLSKHSNQPIPYYDSFLYSVSVNSKGKLNFEGEYEPLFMSRGTYAFSYGYFDGIVAKVEGFTHDDVTIGDVIVTKLGTKVTISEKLTLGFKGKLNGVLVNYLYGYDLIKQIKVPYAVKQTVHEQQEAPEEKDVTTELSELQDIASELMDDINDTLYKLIEYQHLTKGVELYGDLENFIKNKLVL